MTPPTQRRAASLLTSLLVCVLATGLTGCDQVMSQLGIDDPIKKQANQAAEGKAVGGGCRHSGRAIEDCYSLYNWLPKEAIFEGWRDMDAYMRENEITTIAPTLPPPPSPDSLKKKKKKAGAEAGSENTAESNSSPKAASSH